MAEQDDQAAQLKQQLLADLEAQRHVLTSRATSLDFTVREKVRQTTDVPSLVKSHIRKHPLAWASASAVAAFVGTRLLFGRRPSRREKSPSHHNRSALTVSALAGFLGKSAFKALRPMVEKAIRERISDAIKKTATPSLNS